MIELWNLQAQICKPDRSHNEIRNKGDKNDKEKIGYMKETIGHLGTAEASVEDHAV